MSSGEVATAILVVQRSLIKYRCDCSVLCILLYEFFVCLPQETKFIWKGRKSGPTNLYILSRYTALGQSILDCVSNSTPWTSAKSCATIGIAITVFQSLTFAIVAVFSFIRVYALSAHNRTLSICVLVLGLVPVGTNIYATAGVTWSTLYPLTTGCGRDLDFSQSSASIASFVASACLTTSDIIVVSVTWNRIWSIMKAARSAGIRTSLAGLVLGHGTGYFLVLLCLNVVQAVAWSLQDNYLILIEGWVEGCILPLLSMDLYALTSVLICRFTLDLRQVYEHPLDRSESPSFILSDGAFAEPFNIRFARVVTNMVGNSSAPSRNDCPLDVHARGECGNRPLEDGGDDGTVDFMT